METAKMPSTDEWIKKVWYLYTMKFYSAIKNEILSFAGKWTELEIIILGSESQRPHVFSHMWNKAQYKYKRYYEKQVTQKGGHIREEW
jgi:hypothetical protein